MEKKSVHQFSVQKPNGEEVSLKNFDNKVLLIVNTASDCGFTSQLKELEQLRNQFPRQDFEILAFPSNDFGGQEPLEGAEIGKFCEINYDTHFPIFDKIRVRGTYAHPLFQFLADKKQNGSVGAPPRWNFHKYLVNQKGEVIDFFYPFTKPNSTKIKKRINKLLQVKEV
ncbi:glutathione peroxidase [Daejeonella oryzae]|uniref:glutathione peroxidase n=1 Tax=Daejeonella oryzae TaxID=1122943 RepID=UPI000406DFFC|nr:glutathione peroxidase [Daejeonella oryzae]